MGDFDMQAFVNSPDSTKPRLPRGLSRGLRGKMTEALLDYRMHMIGRLELEDKVIDLLGDLYDFEGK